jgi:hypothetical protein
MSKPSTVKRQPPTSEQVVAEQKAQARKLAEARKVAPSPASEKDLVLSVKSAPLPQKEYALSVKSVPLPQKEYALSVKSVPVAGAAATPAPDARTDVQKYLDEVAPASIVGRLVKFSKEGAFVFADTDEPVDEAAEFVALCDQTLIGWIRFHNDGETPPDRVMGLLYDGFQMPARATLGDLDQSEWQAGLSGAPEDPWKHQMCLVLQLTGTGELATFATISTTGRRAVGNLLRHFDRMQRTNPGELPVVRLRAGGFNHRDERVGWVPTPVFAIVGRAPRDSVAKPDTSVAADLNDALPPGF